MGFWIVIAAILLGAGLFLGLALLRTRAGEVSPAAYDLKVYRDQLKDVDRDLARGVIDTADAERLRAEVSRRVLSADAALQRDASQAGSKGRAGLGAAAACLVFVAGGSVALYAKIGAPGYNDLPLQKRLAASEAARVARLTQVEAEVGVAPRPVADSTPEFLKLMDDLRRTLEERPDDLRGLNLLVRNEAGLGNVVAAYEAQRHVIEVRGVEAQANDFALLADLLIGAAGGYVSIEAEQALREALARDPNAFIPRYYLGHYMLQIDRPDQAFGLWEALLNDSPPGAPWLAAVRADIEEVAWRAGIQFRLPPERTLPGPDAGALAAAEDLTPQERETLIRNMVAGLSNRLATEGGTSEEWARLIAAYGVLGETGRARAIWSEALEIFEDRQADLANIRQGARQAGIVE